jgi:radical SAM protein with 4Fe4S-binding SPASM domain
MTKALKKIYLEISNICNLQCSFCPEVVREKKLMGLAQVDQLLKAAEPLCQQVCLHLMGEPLNHPHFNEILSLAQKNNVKLNITTNGTLIHRLLLDHPHFECIEQINFSLQSYPDNHPDRDINQYLAPIFSFSLLALEKRPELYINYRLWNQGSEWSENKVVTAIENFFDLKINSNVDVAWKKSKKLKGRLYLNYDSRFEWPALSAPNYGEIGTCHALDHHIGIHADGTVVPCCLDKEAKIKLGNAFVTPLAEILNNNLSTELRDGFKRGELLHPLCQHCQFATRFKKKVVDPSRAINQRPKSRTFEPLEVIDSLNP